MLQGKGTFVEVVLEGLCQAFDCRGEGCSFGLVLRVVRTGLFHNRKDGAQCRVSDALVVIVPVQVALFCAG